MGTATAGDRRVHRGDQRSGDGAHRLGRLVVCGDRPRAGRRRGAGRKDAERAKTDADRARDAAREDAYRATFSGTQALRWRTRRAERHGPEQSRAPGRDGYSEPRPPALRTEAAACLGQLDGREVGRLETGGSHIRSVDFSPDGSMLASLAYTGRLDLWDVARGVRRLEWIDPAADTARMYGVAPMPAVRFQPGSGRLAMTGWGRRVRWLDTSGPVAEPTTLAGPDEARGLAFDGSGKRMAVAWGNGRADVVDAGSLRLLRSVAVKGYLHSPLAFSPDGRSLASVHPDGSRSRVQVHRLDDPGGPILLASHSGEILCLAFSPDGLLVASGGDDRSVAVSDVARDEEILRLRDVRETIGGVSVQS